MIALRARSSNLGSKRSVKGPRRIAKKYNSGFTKKGLVARYAEVLKLRQALQALLDVEPRKN